MVNKKIRPVLLFNSIYRHDTLWKWLPF